MIYLGADHGGFKLKERIKDYLLKNGLELKDQGTNSEESCDYPVFAKSVANNVIQNNNAKGILVCGTGIGMSISANKITGIRASLCWNEETAKLSREHNDANVLCLGARILDENLALKIVNVWLNTNFSNEERHKRRIKIIE